jgi:hypothetical protein
VNERERMRESERERERERKSRISVEMFYINALEREGESNVAKISH